jgi:hypothetical protein
MYFFIFFSRPYSNVPLLQVHPSHACRNSCNVAAPTLLAPGTGAFRLRVISRRRQRLSLARLASDLGCGAPVAALHATRSRGSAALLGRFFFTCWSDVPSSLAALATLVLAMLPCAHRPGSHRPYRLTCPFHRYTTTSRLQASRNSCNTAASTTFAPDTGAVRPRFLLRRRHLLPAHLASYLGPRRCATRRTPSRLCYCSPGNAIIEAVPPPSLPSLPSPRHDCLALSSSQVSPPGHLMR